MADNNAAGGDGKADDHINLRVVSQDSNEVFFKIKRTTPLRKLMDAYCARNSLTAEAGNLRLFVCLFFFFAHAMCLTIVRFLFDGTRLQPEKTPKEVRIAERCGCVW
jgi:small ubiquitin-related modifier